MKPTRYFLPEPEEETTTNNATNRTKKNVSFKAKNNSTQQILTINANLNYKTKFIPRQRKVYNHSKPKFPGRAPVKKEILAKYRRGEEFKNFKEIRTRTSKKNFFRKEKITEWAATQAARNEILLTQETGRLEAEPGEKTTSYSQSAIVENVDISTATKHFDLKLNDFGPYRAKYTRNGRHLLLGGKLGHVAAFDWMTKKLHCEMNVMEAVDDISWLHIETMFAVAQKKWVYIYDNQGTELHCMKRLNEVLRMEFLPYHFLLATASEKGYLSWLDISIGELVSQYNTKLGRLTLLTQNPYNAILCMGHAKGVVSMWTPNIREPLVKMLCHKSPMSAIAVNPQGTYMATAAVDHLIKIWDIRKLSGPLQYYKTRDTVTSLSFSQKDMLAVGMRNVVEVYKDCCTQTAKHPYLRQNMTTSATNLAFCPFEDVLGVATGRGFTSLIVPGSGEPNFDTLEANPYQTKTQRREFEVKALLEKIQPELICLDPNTIAEVDIPTLQDKIEAKKKLIYLKPEKIKFEPKTKANKRGGSVKASKTKKILQEENKRNFVRQMKTINIPAKSSNNKTDASQSVLDRFRTKNPKK